MSLRTCCRHAPLRSTYGCRSYQTSSNGIFKTEGSRHTFHERKILPYTQRQLYAMVADVDNYYRFIPFVQKSETIKHTGPRSGTKQPWLDEQGEPGEVHKLDHVMQIAALGFEEAWQSHVTCEKYSNVSAYSKPSKLFKHLSTAWSFQPAPSNAPHPSYSSPEASPPLTSPGQSANNSGPTLVSIDLAYEFANPLYAAAISGTFQRVSHKIMGAFEKRVQQVYGEGNR